MSQRYGLIVKSAAQRALAETLPSSAAFAAWEFINGPLRDNPQRVGKPLLPPLQGDWTARRGYLRVRYRIDDAKRTVTVIDVAHWSMSTTLAESRPWAERGKSIRQQRVRKPDAAGNRYSSKAW